MLFWCFLRFPASKFTDSPPPRFPNSPTPLPRGSGGVTCHLPPATCSPPYWGGRGVSHKSQIFVFWLNVHKKCFFICIYKKKAVSLQPNLSNCIVASHNYKKWEIKSSRRDSGWVMALPIAPFRVEKCLIQTPWYGFWWHNKRHICALFWLYGIW